MHQSDQEPKHAINGVELLFLANTIPIGVGVLGMVRFVADSSAHDAWISILVSGFYSQAGILFMWLLLRRFQTMGIYDIHRVLFKKWIGGAMNLLFAFYCLSSYFLVIRTYVEVVQTWMFPTTPVWIMTCLCIVPVFYASISGLQLLGRYAIAAFFLTMWIVLLSYYSFEEGTFSHIMPIGSNGAGKILSGSLLSSLSLLGCELLMVFYPHVTYKKDFLPAATIANWVMVLFYVWNALATLMFFSYEQLRKTIWPMLTMFKYVQLPFIERFETIIIALWILQVVNTSSGYLWAGMRGLEKTMPIRKSWAYGGIFVATLVFGNLIEGRVELNIYLNWLSKVGLAVMVCYPVLLLLLALVLRKKGGQPHEQKALEAPAAADTDRQRA